VSRSIGVERHLTRLSARALCSGLLCGLASRCDLEACFRSGNPAIPRISASGPEALRPRLAASLRTLEPKYSVRFRQ